mmetsp:Transcript_57429/g.105622  ORF Transcript_57429/g.105622 Transcript_57429/m.105622 type:complete len:492 (-) Transcript_57429:128-1603(-)
MEILTEAVNKQQHIRVCSGSATSLAKLLPVKRSLDSVALGFDESRYVRIVKSGKTDLNGGRNGPWTEFTIEPHEDGVFSLRGAKSGHWLTVTDGEFTSSEEPEPLLAELVGATSSSAAPPAIRDASKSPGVDIQLRLADGSNALQWPVRLDRKKKHVLLGTSEENLACGPNCRFHRNGKNGAYAQWIIEESEAGFSLCNVHHSKYLGLGPGGAPILSDTPVLFSARADNAEVPSTLPVDDTVLSAADLAHFKEQGFLVLRNAIPPELVRNALRCINHQLGKPDCWGVDTDPLNAGQMMLKFNAKGFKNDIFNKSPVFWSAVNILLGAGNVEPWDSGTQVALRFPQPIAAGFDIPDEKPGTRYHIDGMGQNKLAPFSLLCGVALSEQTKPNMGNLHVFPGSHLHEDLHKYYRERINDDNQNEQDTNKPDLGRSLQVLLEPGDVVIAHQLLAHRVGINTSEHIRYQLYYRVKHKDHQELKDKILDDPWTEFAI